jgi:2-hydroxychromene-2-carboxylate isomerase
MAGKIEFFFDFGSPNAYMAHRVIPVIETRLNTGFERRPVLLGGVFKMTGNQSPADAFAHIKPKLAYERLEMNRFVAKHGLSRYRHNPHFPINTLQLMRGATAALGMGLLERYMETVFAAMWERGLKMDDPEVFRAVLVDDDLPADALLQQSQSPEVKAALIAATTQFVERGGFGIPTFFVGGEMFFGKDRLADVEEEFLRQREKATAV